MKVVVVDDDTAVRLILQRMLVNKLRCEVIEAKDGEEGLAVIRKTSPDLVLLDVYLPKRDGLGVLEAIRADPLTASVAVVVLSAAKEKEIVLKLVGLGIKDYLLKPLDFEKTLRKLSAIIAKVKVVH